MSKTLTGGDLQTVTDRDKIVYKPLYNYYSSFCYYISAIHRLHSSPTLNKLIQEEKHNLSPIATQLLYLLVNYDECASTKPCQEFTNVIKKVMTSKLKHGGDPQGIITTLFIPLLHQSFPEHTIQILKEINLPLKHFNNNLDKTDFDYTVDKSFNDSLYDTYQEILKLFDEFGLQTESLRLRKFKIATLSIFFSDIYSRASTNSGHAVTLVQDEKNDFYIIDDAHVVLPVKTYLSYIKNSIYEMEVRDMDDETIKHFIEVLGPNYRVDRRIYRIKIKPAFMAGVNQAVSMCGGSRISFNQCKNNFTTNKNEMSQEGGLTISFGNSHGPHHPPPKPHHGPHHHPRIHRQPSKAETIMVCVVISLMFLVIIISMIASIIQSKKGTTTPASSSPGTGTGVPPSSTQPPAGPTGQAPTK